VPDTAAYGTVTVDVPVKTLLFPNTTYGQGTLTLTVAPVSGVDGRVSALALAPVAPNPGFREARVGFSLSRPGHARAAVFAIDGRRVRTLVDAELAAGPHSESWDGRDDAGALVAPGAYVVRLEAEERVLSRRVVWLR
jgi:flagellar hook capping protein FlgD